MLSLCQGNDLEVLADHLLKELSHNKLSNPLQPEIFVVQNHGMGRWLSLHMAQKKGIAANLKFEFPAERMWQLFRLIDADIPQTLPSDRQPMSFSIMQLLNKVDDNPVFRPLEDYIKENSDEMRQLRCWKLSNKIADVFDQYLVYRPEMLLQWEKGALTTKDASERWQAALWQKLSKNWKEKAEKEQQNWTHRAELQQKLFDLIDKGNFNISKLPQRITVFGISTLPPAFIKTFVKLSKLIDIRFYRSPIDNSLAGNSLAESMGGEGREFVQLFEQAVERDDEVRKNYKKTMMGAEGLKPKTLLQNLQANVIHKSKLTPSVEADNSIQLHSCHSPMREVEVMRDQLLALFDDNSELSPDDVVIMTPDIETYAPLIDAVFGTKEEGLPDIPFSIDDGFRKESSLSDTFLKTLDLLQSRFKVTDVMELLEAKPLRIALDISEEDLNLIQQWVDGNHIRWGIDGNFKQEKGLPNSDNFTWKKGLSRILLGYAMRSEGDQIYDKKVPYPHIDGASHAELAGKLSRLLHELFDFYEKVKYAKTADKWHQFCLDLVSGLFPENRENSQELSQICRQIESLKEFTKVADVEVPITFNVIRSFIDDLFDKNETGGFRGRGITFCATAPMRNIPFKVIGMLGMNEGAFPPIKPQVEFDLMRSNPKIGDRSASADGRYLFLETLLSARQHFIISFVGQSNMQDSDFPPSVVVSELLHYLKEEYNIYPDQLTTAHHLQAFSYRYFNGKKPSLFSYTESQLEISRQLERAVNEPQFFIANPLPEPDEDWKNISIQDLVSFFQHPMRYFLQQRLGIYLEETDILTEEREPFAVDGLTGYKIRQDLLERVLKNKDLESYENVAYAADALPVGFAGERSFKQELDEAEQFGTDLKKILIQETKPFISIELDMGLFRITGRLTSLYGNGQWLYRFGSLRGKDCIELWIKHLIYLLSKPDDYMPVTHMVTNDSGSIEQKTLGDIEDPALILGNLLEFYWEGLSNPLMFFPETSFKYAEGIKKEYKPGRAARSCYGQWKSDYAPFPLEGDDIYNHFILRGKDPTGDSSFRSIALNFWQPFFTSNQKVTK